jgi:hypothetical protein
MAAKLFYGLRALHAARRECVAHFLDIGHRRVLYLFLIVRKIAVADKGG